MKAKRCVNALLLVGLVACLDTPQEPEGPDYVAECKAALLCFFPLLLIILAFYLYFC